MQDLHKFLTNPFDDQKISMKELLAFTTDHLVKLGDNNAGGEFTARITATTTALTGVGSTFTDDQTKLGLRKAMKRVKEGFRKSLPASVAKIAAKVVAEFGPDSAAETECFPQGRNVFNTTTDDQVAFHLQTLINGVTGHQAELGAQVVTDATALKTAWLAVYTPSEESSGAKSTSKEAKNAARAALQLELFLNLLAIAQQFPRQPEKLDTFMQQSLLLDHPQQPDPIPAPAPVPA